MSPRSKRWPPRPLTADYTQKAWRSKDVIDTGGALPLTDCYVAPCVSACAIHQDIPEYIRLLGEERYADALDVIYRTQCPAGHHRAHLRPPVPVQLHAPRLRKPVEDPRTEEGGAGKGLGRVPPPLAQAGGHGLAAPGGGDRHGAGRPVGGLLPGARRAPGDAVRARSQRRWRVREHRSALPPARRAGPARHRLRGRTRRQVRIRLRSRDSPSISSRPRASSTC